MIITIDGPSGTGKSTVAREVAKRLGFTFFDTGAMYRSVAWQILHEGVDPADQKQVEELVSRFIFHIRTNPAGERSYFVGTHDVTKAIRTQQISNVASQVAVYGEVRQALVRIQRKFGQETDAVFEGRDMGTVVFPNADLKIFLTAKAKIRAERRFRELRGKFPDAEMSLDQIQMEIEARDETDSTRKLSPLCQAKDAVLIDTSHLTVEQVIQQIVHLKPKKKWPYASMKPFYFFIYWLARFFFRTCFRLKIYGREHFRPGAGILAANHASLYDPEVVSISCPEEVHFLAKGPLFDIPLLGPMIRRLNSHPVERDASDIKTFRLILQLLGEGKKVIIFPEGQRSPDGALQPLERGIAFLVQKAECRIFPVYVHGTYAAWPINQKWPKFFGKVACVFGTSIDWEEFAGLGKKEMQQAILERTSKALASLQHWYETGAKGSPP